jgi:selenocysteine lyase/cysteine desulfurase
MSNIKPLVSPGRFLIPRRWPRFWLRQTYLATAFAGPALTSALREMKQFMKLDARGTEIFNLLPHLDEEIRMRAAMLVDGRPAEVSITANASEGLNKIIGSAAATIAPGDNVVVPTISFQTLKALTTRLHDLGVEVREAAANTEGIIGAIDEHTRLVLVESCNYVTGGLYDLTAIADAAHNVQARIVVDISQTAGIHLIPLAPFDAMVVTTYKWLHGFNGLGFCFWNLERWPDNAPENKGWHSDGWEATARRHELGGNPWLLVVNLLEALRMHQRLDQQRVTEHVRALVAETRTGLQALNLGLTILTPPGDAAYVSVLMKDEKAHEICRRLNRRGVYLSDGRNRLRLSPSIFNGSADVQRVLKQLKRALVEMGYRPNDPDWEG